METAKSEVETLLPSDAVKLKEVPSGTDKVMDVYQSKSIEEEFGKDLSDLWFESRPGSVTVLYRIDGTKVTSVVIDAGTIP